MILNLNLLFFRFLAKLMQREINLKKMAIYLNISQEDTVKTLQEMCNEKTVRGIIDLKNDCFIYLTEKEIESIVSRLNKIKFSKSNLPSIISEIFSDIQLSEVHCDILLDILLKEGTLKGFFTKDEFISLNYFLEFLLQLFWNDGKISILALAKEIKVPEKKINEAITQLQTTNKMQGLFIKNNEEFISDNFVQKEILQLVDNISGITTSLIANKLGLEESFVEKIFDDLLYDGSIIIRQSLSGDETEYATRSKIREEIIKSVLMIHQIPIAEMAQKLRIQYQVVFDIFNQLISQGKIRGYIDSYSGDFIVETAVTGGEEPSPSSVDALLVVENLSVQGKNKFILQDISLALEPKGILGIIGESGTGKSTFLKAIIGQKEITSGNILICGYPITDPEIHNLIGYVPQDLSKIYPNFTCLENMEHFGKQYGLSTKEIKQRSEKIFQDLKILNLKNDYVKNLSGGERRRASIAIAMIHNPKILFLDEPTSGLDPVLRKDLWNMLSNLNEEYGTSLVVVTHYPEEGQYCSKICMFAKNKGIVGIGNPQRLIKNLPGAGRVIILELKKPSSTIKEQLSRNKGIEYIIEERKNEKFRIFSTNPMEMIVKEITILIKMTDIQSISQGEANMTDFFRIKLLIEA